MTRLPPDIRELWERLFHALARRNCTSAHVLVLPAARRKHMPAWNSCDEYRLCAVLDTPTKKQVKLNIPIFRDIGELSLFLPYAMDIMTRTLVWAVPIPDERRYND